MKDEEIGRILKGVGRLERPSTPLVHSLKLPGDPTLAEFMAALESGFSEEYRRQWADSAYCARLMKLHFDQVPPSVEKLVQFQVGQVYGFEESALREYLDEPLESSVRLLLQSPTIIGWAKGLISGATEHAPNILPWARQAIHGGGAIPASMALAVGDCSTTEPEEPFQIQAGNSDGTLVATLWQTAEGKLELDISTANPHWTGKTVRVEILGENGPLENNCLKEGLLLGALPEGRGAAVEYVFDQPFMEIAAQLGRACRMLVLPDIG